MQEAKEILYQSDLTVFIEEEIYKYNPEAKEKKWQLGKLHQEWDKLLWYKRIRILTPRDHLKTFFFAESYVLRRLKFIPNDEVYLFSKTDGLAVKILDRIKRTIKRSPYLKELAGKGSDFWNKTEIRCSNGATIYAQGYSSAIRGGHPKLIILDDPIDGDVIYSDELNKKTIERFFSDILPMAEPDTQIIIIGTLQREDDLYHALDPETWFLKSYDAIIDEEKRISLFPEKWNWQALMERKKEISYKYGEKFWLKEYRNIPINILGEIIKEEWIRYYDVPPTELKIYQGWDLSVGKESDRGDYSACVTFGLDEKGNYYILDVYRERIDFPTRLRMVQEKANQWRPLKIRIEENTFQSDSVQILKQNTGLPIEGIKTTKDKSRRFIEELAPLFENGKVFIKRNMIDFKKEILSLPRGEYDDISDAFLIGKRGLEFENREPAFLQHMKEVSKEMETQRNQSGLTMDDLQRAFNEGRFGEW